MYGLSDGIVKNHVLKRISGATRWRIARYGGGEWDELT